MAVFDSGGVMFKTFKEITVAGTVPEFNRIPFYAKDERLLHHLSDRKGNFK